MANKIRSGWSDDGWGRASSEQIVEGWGNVEENNNNKKATQWEYNNSAQKGKGVCSSSSRGIPRNEPQGWKRKRDFNNRNERGGCKGKRVCNNGNQGCEWKGKRALSNENRGGGWKGKRASSNEIGGRGGKRGSSNSQVSSGGNRVGRVQTLGNTNFHGLNGHQVSLHFPVQSPHLQKILSEGFSLPAPALGFQGQVNDPCPHARQVNSPIPPPTPLPANAFQDYQRPVQDRILSRKVRVTHSADGGWVMEVEEYH